MTTTAITAWLDLLNDILTHGDHVAPRKLRTRELAQRTLSFDMRYPVVAVASRKLNYRFMAAEARWILTGDDRVATIAPYNSRIAEFSDDGKTFFGAYGPKVVAQLPYVVSKLRADPSTRQAGMTLWRENPPPTKDTPCTVAIFFALRHGRLRCHVFMRSSDAWLGVPYDVFNFSMLAYLVCGLLADGTMPGELHLTAASSHLYEQDWDRARACLGWGQNQVPAAPEELWMDPRALVERLCLLQDASPGHPARWWQQP